MRSKPPKRYIVEEDDEHYTPEHPVYTVVIDTVWNHEAAETEKEMVALAWAHHNAVIAEPVALLRHALRVHEQWFGTEDDRIRMGELTSSIRAFLKEIPDDQSE